MIKNDEIQNNVVRGELPILRFQFVETKQLKNGGNVL